MGALATFDSDQFGLVPLLEAELNRLQKKEREMNESMRYAGMLQQSILPNERIFQNAFKDAFVFFQPKDVVSGDFYWIFLHDNDIYFALGDCTGHGVPGAMVNIAGNTLLRQLIRLEGLSDPAQIIRTLDQELTSLFNENLTIGNRRDGMELALCKFNLSTGMGQFCGAGRPLVMIRDDEFVEFSKGSSSIGYSEQREKSFETFNFQLFPGDQFYLFSDGFTDQFGGENVKKFNRKRFRKLLDSIQDMSLSRQKIEVRTAFDAWKGNNEQIDDVCVIGIEL